MSFRGSGGRVPQRPVPGRAHGRVEEGAAGQGQDSGGDPLGGFCAFAGEDGLDEGKEEGENLPEPFGEEFAAPSESDPEKMQEHTLEKSKAEELPTENKPDADGKRKRNPKKEKGYFTEKKPWQRIIVLVAGALMNYVLAVFLIIVCFFAYGQTMTAVYTAEKTDEIPAEFCLQDKDILLKAEKYLSDDGYCPRR